MSLPPPPPPPEPDDRRFLEIYGAWDPMTVPEVRDTMEGFPQPWWVVGGRDRDRVLPLLTAERRRWLAEAVRRTYPDHHPWQPLLDDLASGAG